MTKSINITLLGIVALMFASYHTNYAQSFYKMKLGNYEVIALLDGVVTQNLDQLLSGTQPGEISKLMGEREQTADMKCSVNAYLSKQMIN